MAVATAVYNCISILGYWSYFAQFSNQRLISGEVIWLFLFGFFFPMNRFHLHPLVSSVFEKKKIMPSGTLEQFRGPYNHMNESFPFHLHAIYHILALFRVISSPHT